MGSLDDLKARIKETPISHIIAAYGFHISKKGSSTVTSCPFHDDHDPSMHVNDNKNMFFCFVDNLGGDAIRFVMLYKKLEFIDALKDICEKMGWRYEDFVVEKKKSPKFEMAKKVLTKATQVYRKIATSNDCEPFKKFIIDRGLNEEIANTYSLGFAPWNSAISEYLHSIKNEKDRNFALQIAEELGLIRKDKRNSKTHYDTFRDRIIFPIWDQFGAVIGYTSRATKPDQKAKYMNSIDSFVFNKKDLLYGLHLAKKAIRERDSLIIVEGNMDQISLYSHGFENSVAIMGVALGDSSLKRILPITKNIHLCLDNDNAGWRASERVNKQFMEQGLTPLFVDLGPHKDPDDFLKEEGKLEFQKRLDEAKPFIDVLISKEFPEEIPEVTDHKLKILRQFYPHLAPLKSSLLAEERVVGLAKKLKLQSDAATIIKDYESFLAGEKSKDKPAPARNAPHSSAPPMHQGIPMPTEMPEMEYEMGESSFEETPHRTSLSIEKNISRAERTLLQEVVQNPELLMQEQLSELLDFVGLDEVKRYILRLQELMYEIDESEYETVVSNLLNDEHYSLELTSVASAALFKYRPSVLNEKIIEKMIKDIKKRLQEEQLKTKREELKELQKVSTTTEEFNKILLQLSQLDKELNELKIGNRK